MIIARTVIFLHTRLLRTPTTLSYGCRAIFPAYLIKWLHMCANAQNYGRSGGWSSPPDENNYPKIIYGQRHSITVKLSVWEFLWMDPKHTPAMSWPYIVNTKYSKVTPTFWGHVGRAVTEDFPWVFGTSTWWVHKDHIWSTIIIAMFTVSGFWDHKWPGFTENICPYMVYTTLYLSTWWFWDFK